MKFYICGNGIKVDLDHSKMAVCLSLCPPLITFEPLGKFSCNFSKDVTIFKGTSMQ
jgi:hypothetical protein